MNADYEKDRFAAALRHTHLHAPDKDTAADHRILIAAAATDAKHRPVAAVPAGRRRSLLIRIAAAAMTLPLLSAGLAVAGVTLPEPARDAFEQVGIELPNQPDEKARADRPERDDPGEEDEGEKGEKGLGNAVANGGKGNAYGKCVAAAAREGTERPKDACEALHPGKGLGKGHGKGKPEGVGKGHGKPEGVGNGKGKGHGKPDGVGNGKPAVPPGQAGRDTEPQAPGGSGGHGGGKPSAPPGGQGGGNPPPAAGDAPPAPSPKPPGGGTKPDGTGSSPQAPGGPPLNPGGGPKS